MGHTHFQMRTLKNVRTEMALHVLAYNLKRVIAIMGIGPLIAAMRSAYHTPNVDRIAKEGMLFTDYYA